MKLRLGLPLAGMAVFTSSAASASVSTVPSVPEPGVWVMMIVGFFAVGASLRRDRRAVVRP